MGANNNNNNGNSKGWTVIANFIGQRRKHFQFVK